MKDELVDLAAELGEPVLDAISNNEIIKELPVLGSVVKIVRAARQIPNLLFASKVKSFLEGAESIPEEKQREFASTLHENPDKARRAGEVLLFAIDRAENREKAAIIGRLFSAYILGEITKDDLKLMLHAVDQAPLQQLLKFSDWTLQRGRPTDYDLQLLSASGLVSPPYITYNGTDAGGPLPSTKIGDAFAKIMHRPTEDL